MGGAIANDVHGKNHHRYGTFGEHVIALEIIRTDGVVVGCNNELNSEWMSATIGGLGLTGLITKATIQLRRLKTAFLDSQTLPFKNFDNFFDDRLNRKSKVN